MRSKKILPGVDDADLFLAAPGNGRCEVVCFTSNHQPPCPRCHPPGCRTVIDAWADRTAAMSASPGVEQVFCFENRGVEIGVTLAHPHGQIYGYPFVTPKTAAAIRSAQAHRAATGSNLFADVLAGELADGSRIVAENEHWVAFVPFAARWPVEVHIYPNRFVHNLVELTETELDGFAQVYTDILGRFDRMYDTPLPYISALHQYADTADQREGYFHVELITIGAAPPNSSSSPDPNRRWTRSSATSRPKASLHG